MDIVQQCRNLQNKLNQIKQEIVERGNVAMCQELEQKVQLESLKNQTREQHEILKNNAKELIEHERNKKQSIEQLDQQILIKTKKIAELGRQEMLKKQQLGEVMQKVKSQKRMLEALESQAQKATATWKSNFDIIEQDWNCRVAEINAEEERRLKKVEDIERALRIEIAQKETVERETNRKELELELEKVKISIAEGYSKLKKIHKQTKLVQNYRYLQQMVPMPAYHQSQPIYLNQPSPSFKPILSNNPADFEQCVPFQPPPQPFIPNQPIQSGLLPRLSPSALPAQPSQLVCQFYNQQKLQPQRLMVQDELIRRAAAAVNSNLPSHLPLPPAIAESDSSFNTTTSQTLTDVDKTVQSSSSPSESTTSCPFPVNPINNDIDQHPNSTNQTAITITSTLLIPKTFTSSTNSTTTSSPISTINSSSENSTKTTSPKVNTVKATLFIPKVFTSTKSIITSSPISTVASTSPESSTTISKLISSSTSTLSKSFATISSPISTVASTPAKSSATSTLPKFSTSISPPISTVASASVKSLISTSQLIPSATTTLSKSSPLISTVASTLPESPTTTSKLIFSAKSTLPKSFAMICSPISTVASTSAKFSATSILTKTSQPISTVASTSTKSSTTTSKLISSSTPTLPKSSPLFSAKLDKSFTKKINYRLITSSKTSTVAKSCIFDDGIEIITIDDSEDDDEDLSNFNYRGTIEENETPKSIIQIQKNCNSTKEELIEVNHICGNDIASVAADASVKSMDNPIELTDKIIVRLVPETSIQNFDLGSNNLDSVDDQFELVDGPNDNQQQKFTSKKSNRRPIMSKYRGCRAYSKLRNNKKRKEKRLQRLEKCREYCYQRKRQQTLQEDEEEEPEQQQNSQTSSELNEMEQKQRDGGSGVEKLKQRERNLAQKKKYFKQRIENETSEERERRLARKREWNKQKKANETSEQRERRLAKIRESHKRCRANETPEQRERRLKDLIERQKKRVTNETPEQRRHRLAKARQYYNIRRSSSQSTFTNSKDGISNSSIGFDNDYEDQSGMVKFKSTKDEQQMSPSGNDIKMAKTLLKRKANDNINYDVRIPEME